jgi:hypothetical protein
MPVTLVTDPAEVPMDPSVFPWTVRLKYAKPEELLDDYVQSNSLLGRAVCPVSDYIRDHLDDDILDVEAFIYASPDWGPELLCESIYRTLLFNNAEAGPHGEFNAKWAQHYLALNLVRYHAYPRARFAVEPMLKHWQLRFVSPEAAQVILDFLGAGHPNPRKFLEKPEVLAKFPGLDLTRFAAPDFPEG